MLEICRYWTSTNQYIIIVYDEELEDTYIINNSLETIKVLDDMKNMNIDILKVIVDDFEWMKEKRYGLKVLEELKEEWDIKPRED